MNRALALLLAAAVTAPLLVGLLASAHAKESRSAFTPQGPAHALLGDAATVGLGARRLVSGPLGLALADRPPSKTLLVVLEPATAYGNDDRQAVARFLQQGGRVLVADAFGQASSLTGPFGIDFERVRLVQPGEQGLPETVDGRAVPLHLVRPTALLLEPSGDAQPLALSSPDSYLDQDGDGVIGAGDPPGPFPVVAAADVGSLGGRIVAVSDPGVLAPAGNGSDTNGAWRRAVLASLLPQGGEVVVDESHPRPQDPLLAALSAALAAARGKTAAWALPGFALLLIVAALLPLPSDAWGLHRFRPHRFIRRHSAAVQQAGKEAGQPPSQWTRRGTFAMAAAPALAGLAVVLGNAQVAWTAAFLALACALALFGSPPRIVALRHLASPEGVENTALPVRIELRSRGRAGQDVELLDAVPPEFAVQGGTNWFRTRVTRDTAEVAYEVVPALRGPYALGPLSARCIDPLHLRVQSVQCELAEPVRVTPRRQALNRMPFKARLPSVTLGPHFVNRAGEGSEFHSLREYHEGDSFRSINWRASARSRQLVVSQRVHESRTLVTILLDARAIAGTGPASSTPLAESCRIAVSIAFGALQVRDRVRFVCYGDGLREVLPSVASQQQFELLELLAAVPAAGDMTLHQAVEKILPDLKAGNPVLLLSGLEGDPTVEKGMRLLAGRGLLPMAVCPPLGVDPVDGDPDGPERNRSAILAARRETVQRLRAAGIPVHETVPGIPLDHLFRLGVAL